MDNTCSLFRGLQKEEVVLLTHGDSVDKVADGFKVVARSGNIVAGIANESKNYMEHSSTLKLALQKMEK